MQSGNNLVIDLLGTSDSVTVNNWFGSSAGAQMQSINAGSLKITSGVAALVSAMHTYQQANPSFNPVTATAMPTDSGVQTAISNNWHS